jgi:hypothetical protein
VILVDSDVMIEIERGTEKALAWSTAMGSAEL